jgi:prepilin-type N-terminal cleavage/methylation domain-containing protein
MSMSADRRGMTLLEIVLALALSSAVVLGAAMLLDSAHDLTSRISRDGSRVTREGNGAEWLRRSLRDAAVDPDSTKRFHGEAQFASFRTSCPRPQGWSTACRIALSVDSIGDSSSIAAELETGQRLILMTLAGHVQLRYFDAAAADSGWLRLWDTHTTLPTAIAFVTQNDTTMYPVGAARE